MADRIVVMNHGSIEQIGTPEAIYGKPASAFVADFVGTMNFIEAQVTAAGRVDAAGLALHCDTGAFGVGTSVQVCLRPEDVRVRGVTAQTQNAVALVIDEIEFLGAFGRASLRAVSSPGLRLVGDFSSNLIHDHELRPGVSLTVALPPERLVVFARA